MQLLTSAKTRILLKKRRLDEVDRRVASAGYRIYMPGETIHGKHRVVRALTGGFGLVYFCQTLGTYGPIVIKTILPEYFHSDAARRMFYQEAEAWIRLGDHDNLVKALYVGELDECLAIHFDMVIGDPKFGNDLSGYLGRYEFRPDDVLLFGIRFCRGMIHASQRFHELGTRFVHSDIKPSNVLVTRNLIPKITDLGLVHIEGAERVGAIGTPGYIAPEVYAGLRPSPASDIYSFGCVLFELLSGGKPPFSLNADELNMSPVLWGDMIQHKHETQPLPAPGTIFPEGELGCEIYQLVDRCLRKNPAERFPSFDALSEPLEELYLKLGRICSDECHHDADLNDSGDLHHIIHGLDNRAQSLSRLGHFEESLQCWDKLIEISSGEPRALRGKGDVLATLGRYSEALACYDVSLERMPNDIEQWMDKGLILFKQTRLQEAIRCFDKALTIKVQPNTIWGNKGHPVEIHRANTSSQIQAFQRWYENEMKKGALLLSRVYVNKARVLAAQGDHSAALDCVEHGLLKNPSSAEAWREKGMLLAKLERMGEANRCFDQALSIVPEEWEHELGLSVCGDGTDVADIIGSLPKDCEHGRIGFLLFKGVELLNQGNPVEALLYLEEYCAFHEENVIAYWFIALALYAADKPSEAIKWLDKCISSQPDWADPWSLKGELLSTSGEDNLQEAVGCFRRALDINDVLPMVHRNLALTLHQLGNDDEVKDCIRTALNVSDRWVKKGLQLTMEEKYNDAINDFDKVLSFLRVFGYPEEQSIAVACKGTALLGLRRHEEAVEMFNKALKAFPDDVASWGNRGLALYQLGKIDEALQSYEEALRRDPNDGAVLANKASILSELGRTDEASECMEKSNKMGFSGRCKQLKFE
jgi:tetratricopeptide (TPR) repeat protein